MPADLPDPFLNDNMRAWFASAPRLAAFKEWLYTSTNLKPNTLDQYLRSVSDICEAFEVQVRYELASLAEKKNFSAASSATRMSEDSAADTATRARLQDMTVFIHGYVFDLLLVPPAC